MQKKIMMIGNSYLAIFGLRSELIEQLIARGYEVWTIFPNGPFGNGEEKSKQMGCYFVNVDLIRRGKNIFQEICLFIQYLRVIKSKRPDLVLAYTVKPIVYAGAICRVCHIPFMPNITGLGEALQNSRVVRAFYKLAVKNAECIFFQNAQDKFFFENNGFDFGECVLLPGSGVNLERYRALEYQESESIKFTYIARVMRSKGIEEFLQAATKMKEIYHDKVEFHVCGICEQEYEDLLERYQKDRVICYHGLVHDIQNYYEDTHCVVMPSYYPEGMSNVLLEAAASGRPIITTDRAGCKEVVEDSVSGYLIREKDSIDLFTKMEKFYHLPYHKRSDMGLEGRKRVEKLFDRKIVVDLYMKHIDNCVR